MQINPWDGKNFGAESVRQQVETSLKRLKVIKNHYRQVIIIIIAIIASTIVTARDVVQELAIAGVNVLKCPSQMHISMCLTLSCTCKQLLVAITQSPRPICQIFI